MPRFARTLLSTGIVAVVALGVGVIAPATAASASTSHVAPFTTTVVDWNHLQRPSIDGVVQTSSISLQAAPGPAAGRPVGKVVRYVLNPRARFVQGSQSRARVETYGRYPTSSARSTPATAWPDPIDSTRWYTFSLYLPKDFQTTTGSDWIVLTQWKGLDGGSPPISLEVKKNFLRLGGARTNHRLIPNDGNIGALPLGKWTTITVGMGISPKAKYGWVMVVRDGKTVLKKTPVATMDTIKGKPDPIYLKQGIYQNAAWTKTHIAYLTPVVVSATYGQRSTPAVAASLKRFSLTAK